MEKTGKYNNVKIVGSAIATALGVILLFTKTYSPLGIILLFFGGTILQFSIEARRKEIISDELTEWISGKSYYLSYMTTLSTIAILIAVDLYKPGFLEINIALGIVLLATIGAAFVGEYYYGKIKKNIGF